MVCLKDLSSMSLLFFYFILIYFWYFINVISKDFNYVSIIFTSYIFHLLLEICIFNVPFNLILLIFFLDEILCTL